MDDYDINSYCDYRLLCQKCNLMIHYKEYELHTKNCGIIDMNKIKEVQNTFNSKQAECTHCKFIFPLERFDIHETKCYYLSKQIQSLNQIYQQIKEKIIVNNMLMDISKPRFIELDHQSSEYLHVSDIFYYSESENSIFKIVSIKRVINPMVLFSYEKEKSRIQRVHSIVEEDLLFSTTYNYLEYESPEIIAKTGFEKEKCKKLYLGKGLYFYEDVSKAVNKNKFLKNEVRSVILSKVIIGKTKVITKKDEDKNLDSSKLFKMDNNSKYDSVNSWKDDYYFYVVYDDCKTQPLYLIEFDLLKDEENEIDDMNILKQVEREENLNYEKQYNKYY